MKREIKTEMLHIRISPKHKKWLEKWAIEEKMSIGALINEWIEIKKKSTLAGIKADGKYESFNFRLPTAYKEFIDLYSRRIGLSSAEYINELIRKDIEKTTLDFSRYEQEEKAFIKRLKECKEAAV